MTKEEGARRYYQAVRDYDSARSEKQQYQRKVDDWSASRGSYVGQREAKEVEIREKKNVIANLKSGRSYVIQLLSEEQHHNQGKEVIAEGLTEAVRADDVLSPDVEGALNVTDSSLQLQLYDQNISEEENRLADLERERNTIVSNIENCDRQIRSYSSSVDEATRNMRSQQRKQDEYRKYLYM